MSVLTLHVSCSSSAVRAEKRFDKSILIPNLKQKLEMVVGVPAAAMKLIVKFEGETVCVLEGDDAMLGSFPVSDFMELYVQNTDATAVKGEFEDVSKVEKFELSEEEYATRRGTVMDFKKRNQLGRFNPELQEQLSEKDEQDQQNAAVVRVGDRCEATTKTGKQRGVVRYVGHTKFASGYWVGVELDEPFGKHDGTVEEHQYFECDPSYGIFVKPAKVETGDYPPIDDLELSDDEM